MHLPRSQALVAELVWLSETASTNDVLRETVARNPAQADCTVIATDNQTAGRGRLGREWVAPPGQTLAFSVLVREFENELGVSWLPLIAGSAVRRALAAFLPEHAVAVKWPNDVLVAQHKVSGILCEVLPDGSVIVGIGINTLLGEEELPTPTATSLRIQLGHTLESADLADRVLSAVLIEFFALLDLAAAGESDMLRDIVSDDSRTLGTMVRALLPNGDAIEGRAVRLAADGSLVLHTQATDGADAQEVVVAAGDIQHLR